MVVGISNADRTGMAILDIMEISNSGGKARIWYDLENTSLNNFFSIITMGVCIRLVMSLFFYFFKKKKKTRRIAE